ncbi:MAG: sulfotransferase family protein, partial [Terriglobia bacterium]
MAARRLNFFVIGAMKAGTTSLHYYLKEHPGLFLPIEKEIPFFAMDELYERGMDWYLDEFFSKAGTGQLLGTVSPPYMLNSKAAERIYRALPDVKLIALLRDPIDRAKSQYKMLVRAFG